MDQKIKNLLTKIIFYTILFCQPNKRQGGVYDYRL